MTKQQFIEKLKIELQRNHVSDFLDIVAEYEQHFAFKLADGYSEEEIAAKLGDPKALAAQYEASPADYQKSKKTIAAIGLGFVDFFFGILCVLLCAWEIVMCASAVASGTLSVCFVGKVGNLVLFSLPEIPYHCAVILGVAFAALATLAAVGTVYFFGFIHQLMRSFARFHQNTLASASGKAVLPSVTVYPQFSAKIKRRLRKLALFSVTVFAACFISAFIVCAITAGALEFWHVWGWFGYVA